MRPVVYSASSINAYIECHLKWYFTHVLLEEEAESEAREVGIAVHEYAERRLRWTRFTDTRSEDAEKAMLEADRSYRVSTNLDLLDVFDTEILPTYGKPVLIEASFQLELNGIPYSGVIDALDEQDLNANIVDWDSEGRDGIDPYPIKVNVLRDLKTTKQRPQRGKYRLNMTGYWIGATILGYRPDAAQLDYIVRTKKPYYWPEVMDPITDDDVAVLASTLAVVAEGVERGDYQPTGLGTTACSYCGYKAICGPYQRYQEASHPLRKEAR